VALTLESAGSLQVVDTAAGKPKPGISLTKSLTITESQVGQSISLASAATWTIDFSVITAAKVIAVKTTGVATLTFTVNSQVCVVRVNTHFLLIDSGGGITAASITQSTGSAMTIEVDLAG
jgi:hypothetical protein